MNMRYLLLIYSDPAYYAKLSEQDMGQLMAAYGKFSQDVAPKTQDAARLQPTATATTVRVRNGDLMTTDGPFAETKEELGGYYLIEAKDLDEAIAVAAKVPTAEYGSIEVRPVWEMEG
jgi:hypothetical protein